MSDLNTEETRASLLKSRPENKIRLQNKKTVNSNIRKYVILFIITYAATLAPLSSTIYFPALAVIGRDLNATNQLVDITVSAFMFTVGVFPLLWGGLADRFGRKGVFLAAQVIFNLGSIGCALATSIEVLILLRIVQGIGAAAPAVIGMGIISDIFNSEELGFVMSLFFVGPLVGPVIGPIIGGFISDAFGWRSTFWFLIILGGILLILSVILVPETLPSYQKQLFPVQITLKPFKIGRGGSLFNPLSPLIYLKYPLVGLGCFCIAIAFGAFFAIGSSISRVFPIVYGLSPSESGVSFIPLGVGSILGNLVGGKIADMSYNKYQSRYPNSTPPPEVRLYGLWLGSLVEVCGLLMAGWFIYYSLPLAATLVATFLIGFGNTVLTIGCSSYLIDHFPNNAGSISACFVSAQLVFTAILTAVNLPILDGLGFHWGVSLYALLCFIVCFIVLLLIYFGANLRSKTGPKLDNRKQHIFEY